MEFNQNVASNYNFDKGIFYVSINNLQRQCYGAGLCDITFGSTSI